MMKRNVSIWQEFCYDLIEARKEDVLEEPYQNIVESNLRQLGWSKVQGEICPKERINVGSHNQVEPDITMKLDGEAVFVIELKRPRNVVNLRQEQQLLSYMRLRKTSFGLYIGHDIRLYYDSNADFPMLVWDTEIDLNARGGSEFVDFFSRDTFNRQRIEIFCSAKAKHIRTKEAMANFRQALSKNQDLTIKRVLIDYFVELKQCDKELVSEMLQDYHFSLQDTKRGDVQPIGSSGVVIAKSSIERKKRDVTKYSLDGGKSFYGKGKFVREVVVRFMAQNPSLTFEQLLQVFPAYLQGSYGVIRSVESLESSTQDKKDLASRYAMSENMILTSSDGVRFAVSTQWGAFNFINILNLLEKWGWSIVTNI